MLFSIKTGTPCNTALQQSSRDSI